MNSLSWLIYLADVVESIGNTLGIVCYGSIIVSIICLISFFIASAEGATEAQATIKTILKWAIIALAGSRLIAVPIPSSQTVYAIAASEMGEKVLASQTGGKAIQALNAWLDKQISQKPEK